MKKRANPGVRPKPHTDDFGYGVADFKNRGRATRSQQSSAAGSAPARSAVCPKQGSGLILTDAWGGDEDVMDHYLSGEGPARYRPAG